VGARFAAWARNPPEVIFRTADGSRLMAVPYSVSGDSFRAEKPYLWAEGTFGRPNGTRGYDIHPDGKRVAASGGPQSAALRKEDKAVFVFNFFDELRRIAPAGGH
jgi:hypothetical protein